MNYTKNACFLFALSSTLLININLTTKPTQGMLSTEMREPRTINTNIDTKSSLTAMAVQMFVSGEHPTSGKVNILQEGGETFLEFQDDFKTDSGPDLFVILHKSKDVIGTTKAPTHSIKEGDYVIIEPLQKTKGKQRYKIPSKINLKDYQSVAIWCRQFNATFGSATLP